MPFTSTEIRNIFRRPVAPVETTPHYRLRLLTVLAGLVTLQLLYLALVAFVCAGTLTYLFVGLGVFAAGFNFITVILYLGPPIVGVVTILFLLNPLLVLPAKPPQPVEIRPEEEPLLFEFVTRLCDALGSPRHEFEEQ